MNLRVLLTTFGLIFLAEMGDKTQLAAISMVGKTKAPWAVLIGACLALCLVSAIGVLGGAVVLHYVPEKVVQRLAAGAFIVTGVLMLFGKL